MAAPDTARKGQLDECSTLGCGVPVGSLQAEINPAVTKGMTAKGRISLLPRQDEETVRMPMKTTVACLAGAIVLAGCGGDSSGDGQSGEVEENAVRLVIADLQAASRDGDGDLICNEIFTTTLADSITSASNSGSCAKEVQGQLFTPHARIVVDAVEVQSPTEATATVTEHNGNISEVSLLRQGGEWRVSGVKPA